MPDHTHANNPNAPGTPGFLTVTLPAKKQQPDDVHLYYYPPGY
jgi:hypothetical protein